MAYQALYRSWRPRTFTEMCGQDAITQTLKRQVTTGHIAHAYLFCGTRGTGKTTAAKVLSRAINCTQNVDGDPCGTCDACRALMQENCMDVMEIDAASNNGVDEIRDLREKIKYPPTVVKYKVYIIDEVHMLSTGAFNALLKTLEEPPQHAVFILATTEPQKLPATILSRCQRFDFHRMNTDVMVERMMVVLGGIGREAEPDALLEIARAAEGAMRDALSLLDVCLSRTDGVVTAALAREAMGTAGRGNMFRFADAILSHDAGRALNIIDEMLRIGCDPQVFARDAAEHLRGVLLAKTVGEAITGILECAQEDAQEFLRQAEGVDEDQLMRQMDLYMRCDPDMKWATRPRTLLELATVRACHPEREPDAQISERLARLEKLAETGAMAAPAPKAAVPEKKAPAPAKKTAPAVPANVEKPPQEYLDAVQKLAQENGSIRAAMNDMRFAGIQDGVLRVEFPKAKSMFKALMERKQALLDEAFTQAFGTKIRVSLQLEGAKAEKPAANSSARDAIGQAYDIFGRDKIDLYD